MTFCCISETSLVAITANMDVYNQNRIYTPYMTVYLVISLPKISYLHCTHMVLANPTNMALYDQLLHLSSTAVGKYARR